MNPNVILDGSFELYDAYLDVHNKILVNLARHFPYAKSVPSGSFQYQAKMLAQMGMIDKETANIIMGHMRGVAGVVKEDIEAAILEGIGPTEPKLRAAAQKGFLRSSALPDPVPEQMYAFRAYYNQSIDKMNLVNTTMLESTREVYRATVADISQKIEEIQTTLNAETASVISGVATYNQAVKSAVDRMVETGITGYVDHAGRHWRPEVYSAMVIRTTSANAARQAVFERNEQYGNDLYQVSTHDGARPLCYPWQGKVISKSDWSREVEDFEGNKVHVYAQSETSYGEAAGLFGVNCGHYPMVFIPGFSSLRGEPQDPEENAKTYEESQKQRALERKVRDEKLKYDVEKARGADPERLKYQRQKVRDASNELDQFCKDTGRARRRYREYHPINATWPDRPDGINPPLGPTNTFNSGPIPPGVNTQTPEIEIPKAEPVRIVVDGTDMSKSWHWTPDQSEFAIDDIIHKQGFDGLPKVVSPEEFEELYTGDQPLLLRTYSAPDSETLESYSDMLRNGEFYVDCSAGGAQYGQGMYSAGIYGPKGSPTMMKQFEGAMDEMTHYQTIKGRESMVSKIETMTLDPSAKVVKLTDIKKDPEYKLFVKTRKAEIDTLRYTEEIAGFRSTIPNASYIPSEVKAEMLGELDSVEALVSKGQFGRASSKIRDIMSRGSELEVGEGYDYFRDVGKAEFGEVVRSARRRYGGLKSASEIATEGVYAASKGYDAINARGHGSSGSYTVVLNRTKLIIKGD